MILLLTLHVWMCVSNDTWVPCHVIKGNTNRSESKSNDKVFLFTTRVNLLLNWNCFCPLRLRVRHFFFKLDHHAPFLIFNLKMAIEANTISEHNHIDDWYSLRVRLCKNFVADLCTCSTAADCLFKWGDHTEFQTPDGVSLKSYTS